MNTKILALTLPIGLIIELTYFIMNRFFIKFPDVIAYPVMTISILPVMTGLAYDGYCLGKHKNPYAPFIKNK